MSTKKKETNKIMLHYSEAFRLKVVGEIEKGILTVSEAVRLYEISYMSIYRWLRKYGKKHLISKIVRVEMKDEKDIIKAKEERIRELEQALSSITVQNICQKCYIESLESRLTEEEKKTLFSNLSPEQKRVLERLK